MGESNLNTMEKELKLAKEQEKEVLSLKNNLEKEISRLSGELSTSKSLISTLERQNQELTEKVVDITASSIGLNAVNNTEIDEKEVTLQKLKEDLNENRDKAQRLEKDVAVYMSLAKQKEEQEKKLKEMFEKTKLELE